MPLSHNHLKTAFLALSGFFLFSTTDAMAKILTGTLGPFAISFWSALAGFLFLLVISPWCGGLGPTLRTDRKRWHFVRAVLTCFIQVLNFVAFKAMPLVNFYTIVFTAPFITVVLASIFFREKISGKTWILIAGGFGGVLIAMRPSMEGVRWPEVAVLLSALFFSVRNMTVPKMGEQETMLSYGLYTYAGIVAGSLMALLATGTFAVPPRDTWLMFTLIGALGAIGIILTSASFRTGPASIAAPMHYSQIIWGLLFGALIFSDLPDRWDITGAIIVCLCGILVIERRADKPGMIPADS